VERGTGRRRVSGYSYADTPTHRTCLQERVALVSDGAFDGDQGKRGAGGGSFPLRGPRACAAGLALHVARREDGGRSADVKIARRSLVTDAWRPLEYDVAHGSVTAEVGIFTSADRTSVLPSRDV